MRWKFKTPRRGYVRAATELPVLAVTLHGIPDMPRVVLGLMTEDGPLALAVDADTAREIADLLARAAAAMRTMPSWKLS